jgi:hypothetical protein
MPLPRFKVLTQLGVKQTSLFAWYQWGLKSGYLRWKTRSPKKTRTYGIEHAIELPDPEQLCKIIGAEGRSKLYAEAEEIISGKIRLFGSELVDLSLEYPEPLKHWIDYREKEFDQDIKFVWEPARFGWAVTLARAYFLDRDERFARSFWTFTENFIKANPAFQGPHWMSAQEVAIRLASLVFAFQIFRSSPHSTPERISRLSESIAQHAERIPPTLAYARAQNNNHLLTEAMGLITASIALSSHPAAPKWHTLGWKWFHRGLQAQISDEGVYIQHSTNYHRLMLQTALWVYCLAQSSGKPFPKDTLARLAMATRWLSTLLDAHNGYTPNLGPNDGANIFPLSILPFGDFRPTLQASGLMFLGIRLFPEGAWDEMRQWLCIMPNVQPMSPMEDSDREQRSQITDHTSVTPHILRSAELDSWAYMRAAQFTSRPGHADQLHIDLWWHGLNIAQDPGTYLYNAPAPWDNALTSTFVHNTITINEQEQMTRAGRFLYLDWAQGEIIYAGDTKLVARHNGYRHLGITHQRTLETRPDGWLVEDQIIPHKENMPQTKITARLHWLLPDWEWKMNASEERIILELLSPYGWIALKIAGRSSDPIPVEMQDLPLALVRAGRLIFPKENKDEGATPTWGWISPTYGVKLPALSFSLKVSGFLPLVFTTSWELSRSPQNG